MRNTDVHFKPLGLGVVCYTAKANRYSMDVHLYKYSFKSQMKSNPTPLLGTVLVTSLLRMKLDSRSGGLRGQRCAALHEGPAQNLLLQEELLEFGTNQDLFISALLDLFFLS